MLQLRIHCYWMQLLASALNMAVELYDNFDFERVEGEVAMTAGQWQSHAAMEAECFMTRHVSQSAA